MIHRVIVSWTGRDVTAFIEAKCGQLKQKSSKQIQTIRNRRILSIFHFAFNYFTESCNISDQFMLSSTINMYENVRQ